ncbi:MAG: insulinase family protein [Pseudomonadota bacterium]
MPLRLFFCSLCTFVYLVGGSITSPAQSQNLPYQQDPRANVLAIQAIDLDVPTWLISNDHSEMVSVRLTFLGGTSLADNRTIAQLSTSIGDVLAITPALKQQGISLSFTVTARAWQISIYALKEDLPLTMDSLAKLLRRDFYTEQDFIRAQDNLIAQREADAIDPDFALGLALDHTLKDGTPLARTMRPQRIKSLTLTQMDHYLNNQLQRAHLRIAVAGDVRAADLKALLAPVLAALPATPIPTRPPLRYGPCALCGDDLAIAWDTDEALVALARHGPRREDPDYYPLRVALSYLSGGLSSRLMAVLREELNLTYGAQAFLSTDHIGSGLFVYATTRNEDIPALRHATSDIFYDVIERGMSEADLTDSKQALIESFYIALRSNRALSEIMAGWQTLTLTPNHQQIMHQAIADVSHQDIRRAAARYLDPAGFATIAVGRIDDGFTSIVTLDDLW